MDTTALLVDVYDRIQEEVHAVLEGLDEKALTTRPEGTGNSIAWTIWHLTRVQDDHVAQVAGHEQVHTAEGWYERFGLPFDPADHGYGHTSDQVDQVRASAELLGGYHDAVHLRTVAYLKTLTEADLDRIVDRNWDPPVTLGVRLVSVVADDLEHVGQAAYVKGLIS